LQVDPTSSTGIFPPRGIRYEALDTTWLNFERTLFPSQTKDFQPPTDANAVDGLGASIAEISAMFGHDEEQWRCFSTAATALVETVLAKQANNDASQPNVVPLPSQLLMQVVGPAGTGKSAVINALLYLTTRLGNRDNILTLSPSGVAAIAVDGLTCDSFTNVRQAGYQPLTKGIDALCDRYAALNMVIIDEISLLKHIDFWLLDTRLREIMRKPDAPFGGLHVVLFGDFLQIPPVKYNIYLYEYPRPSKEPTLFSRQIMAWELYRQFTTVVCLTQVHRQTDAILRGILARLREGTVTQEDLETLNARVVGATLPPPVNLEGVVGVIGNDTRHLVSELQQATWLRHCSPRTATDEAELPIKLVGCFSRAGAGPLQDPRLIAKLTRGSTAPFRGRPGELLVTVGMPVIFGDNLRYTDHAGVQRLAVANGTTGRIYGLQFPVGTTFSIHGPVDGQRYLLPSAEVLYVLVQVDNPRFPSYTDLPAGVFPIRPSAQTGDQHLRNISLRQVPIAPNFASTIHKLQSQTLDQLTIAELTTKDMFLKRVTHASFLYVLLSRVRTLAGLFLLQPITWDDIANFSSLLPSFRVELSRLEQLAHESRETFPYPSTAVPDLTPSPDPANPTPATRATPKSTPTAPSTPFGNAGSLVRRLTAMHAARPDTVGTPCRPVPPPRSPISARSPFGPVGLVHQLASLQGRMQRPDATAAAPSRLRAAQPPSPVSQLLQCIVANHTNFGMRYGYGMHTAPPTGIPTVPIDEPNSSATFTWLYMPVLLNALATSSQTMYFPEFLAVMPRQYRMLVCVYRRFFQRQNVTFSHAAATADGPLHFSQANQELLMSMPPLFDELSPRTFCETLAGLVLVHGSAGEKEITAFFSTTTCTNGFPFPPCSVQGCLYCPFAFVAQPLSVSSPLSPLARHMPVANPPHGQCFTGSGPGVQDPVPQRRISTWQNNSCYVDAALQAWYHVLQVAAIHCHYEFTAASFAVWDNIPHLLQRGLFPINLRPCLCDWLECKLMLEAASTAREVGCEAACELASTWSRTSLCIVDLISFYPLEVTNAILTFNHY
jgi:PIF1-like helicase